MWKDYFYFTKSERRGTIVLVVLIGILIIVRTALSYTHTEEKDCPLTPKEVEQLHQLEQQMSLLTAGKIPAGKIDPCQLDSSGFVKVGFTADQAHELITIKRGCVKEEFPLLFMDYAIKVDEEWINHIKY